jgi:hypothetical protein
MTSPTRSSPEKEKQLEKPPKKDKGKLVVAEVSEPEEEEDDNSFYLGSSEVESHDSDSSSKEGHSSEFEEDQDEKEAVAGSSRDVDENDIQNEVAGLFAEAEDWQEKDADPSSSLQLTGLRSGKQKRKWDADFVPAQVDAGSSSSKAPKD